MLEYREIEKKIKAIKEENYNYENYKYEIEKREIKIYNKDFNIENAFSYYETQGHTFIIEK